MEYLPVSPCHPTNSSIFGGHLTSVKDTYRHKGLRNKLVEDLRSRGIQDESVLSAMLEVPRHFFIDKGFEDWSYQDKAFPIGHKQTISQPYTVAYQTSLIQVKKRKKILEVGTGSGYQATILAVMGARVYTVERQKPLYQKTKQLLDKLSVGNIRTYFRDGYKGLPEFAPFDAILVTAGAMEIPQALKDQLAIGGRLVIPVGQKDGQVMYRITRINKKEYKEEKFDRFRFVPFLEGLNKIGD